MLNRLNSLRSKMLLTAGVALLLMFALLFFVARGLLLDSAAKLEKERIAIRLNSAVSLFDDQSKQLSLTVLDNARWDDMYEYIEKPTQRFIDSAINIEMHRNLKVHAIFIVNNLGSTIFQRGYDYINDKPWAIPDLLQQTISKNGLLANQTKGEITGFFGTPQGIFIVTSHDILDSEASKPANGKLIMARLLTKQSTQALEKTLSTNIEVKSYSNNELANALPLLVKNQSVIIPLDDSQIVGYAKLDDLGGNANLLLKVKSDRKIYAQGKSNLNFFYWSLALIALILTIFSWLFDKFIIRRIASLDKSVKNIDVSAVTSVRIAETDANDEINSLAHGINGMLARLDESQQALQLEKERAQITLAGIADAVITTNPNGDVTYVNAAAERLTGVSNGVANLKPLSALFHLMSEDELTLIDCAWLTDATSVLDEVKFERADGQKFLLTKSTSATYDEKMAKYGTVTVIHDVTMLRKLSTQVSYQAKHDQLTGLINRYEFERKLQEALDETASDNRMYCLAYFDLDRFKIVNDTCGHNAGDLLLQQLSNLIKSKVRSSDILARLGGDEFALLLNGCDIDKAYQIIESLRDAVQDYRFTYEDKLFKVGVSFGLSKISIHQTLTIGELFGTVDSACYEAKSKGGNRIQIHNHDDVRSSQRLNQQNWVADVQSALQNNQFVLFSQKINDLTNNREDHMELLIRLRGNEGQLYPPSSFLPAAERYHLMPQIDRWVIHEALRIIASKGADFTTVCAINLSGQSLSDDTLLKYIVKQIKHHNVNPKRICFEITETAVIANIDQARLLINDLRDLGCRFSLDDFGSGLSSFAYLKNLQVDYLKIDGMFVKNIVDNKIDRAMVESINNVGHVMGLQTIGEFAENQAIIDVLKAIGVDYAQGYGVAMPVLFE